MERMRHASLLLLPLIVTLAACPPAPAPVACDPACAPGFTCAEGVCVPGGTPADMTAASGDLAGCNPACTAPTPYCDGRNTCVACLMDDQCGAAQICKNGACVAGCNVDNDCRRKGGAASSICCGGACADPQVDVANCGGCGTKCASIHARATCAGGKCSLGKCDVGWDDCDKSAANGCETNLNVDPANCTGCGQACKLTNAKAGCSHGCYLEACNFGFDDCNSKPEDGCETPVLTDPKNCGGCGNSCSAPPHAKATCQNAVCILTNCDLGYTDCDGNVMNGCETVTGTDANNCGACKNVCPQGLVCQNSSCTCPQCNIPNAKSVCVNNMCQFDSCLMGFGNCDNNPANGCEVNLNTDGKNCAACNNVCPQNAPNCFNGQCMSGFTHHTGCGQTWVDNVPTGTLTQAQALRACQEYVNQKLMGGDTCNPNGCGCGGQNNCVYNNQQQPRYTWFYNMDTMGGTVTLNCCGCASMKWD